MRKLGKAAPESADFFIAIVHKCGAGVFIAFTVYRRIKGKRQ
jgi:hypothetical protein